MHIGLVRVNGGICESAARARARLGRYSTSSCCSTCLIDAWLAQPRALGKSFLVGETCGSPGVSRTAS